MNKIKQLSFEGQTIFCGIDVHKKSWRVNVRSDEFELEDYSQDPSEELLLKHLDKRYPGASFKLASKPPFSYTQKVKKNDPLQHYILTGICNRILQITGAACRCTPFQGQASIVIMTLAIF